MKLFKTLKSKVIGGVSAVLIGVGGLSSSYCYFFAEYQLPCRLLISYISDKSSDMQDSNFETQKGDENETK